MRYRNTISGEVIEVDAPISGEFWEDAEEAETEDPNKKGGKKA